MFNKRKPKPIDTVALLEVCQNTGIVYVRNADGDMEEVYDLNRPEIIDDSVDT